MSASVDAARRQHVTAVVVAHNGERWLPRLITALVASTRQPDRVVAVDTGSADGSRRLLVEAFGTAAVLDAARTTGFGASAVRALAASDREATGAADDAASNDRWIWLLPDDCAPAADALERLLETATSNSSIAVAGCRVRAWPWGRRLLEVGATITGTGHRETGVEPGEYDEGQYDQRRDVLSVSSAAMLVRRSVWDQLGGFDPELPLFGDDLDFGWRAGTAGHRVVVAAGAVVFHAEAAVRGLRAIDSTTSNPQRAARRAALFTLLANCRGLGLPFLAVRLLVGSMLRAAGYLLGKRPSAAWNEAAAAVSVLGRPDRVVAARARRRSLAGGDSSALRALRPTWWTPYANAADALASQFIGRRSVTIGPASSSVRLSVTGRKAVAHPLLLLAALGVAGLLASRGLWGEGYLQGGGLLPAPDSATRWWSLYGETWHPVRLGSIQPTAPYVVALAVGATVLLGKAWLLVDLLMLFAPVLAVGGAFAASGRLVSSRAVRVWMAATYALLPVLSGATSAGRIGTVAATILLPWLVLPVAALLRGPGWPWRPACAAAAVSAVGCAFVPMAWVLAAVLLGVAGPLLVVRRHWRAVLCALVALLLSGALLLPWSQRFILNPHLLLTEAGATAAAGDAGERAPWQLAFGRLGAPDQAPWWLMAGLVAAALLALLRAESRPRVAGAWAVCAIALGVAAVMSRQLAQPPGATVPGPVWLGFPVIVSQAALIVAAGLGADGLRRRRTTGSFGWRRPLGAAAVAIGVSAPVAGVVWWAGTAPHGDLHRQAAVPLPAYMADAMDAPAGPRVLVIRGTQLLISYDVLAGDGRRLGDDSVLPPLPGQVTTTVAPLLAAGQSAGVAGLPPAGIGYVVLPRPADPGVETRLDALAGLTRVSTSGLLSGWQVEFTDDQRSPSDADLTAVRHRSWQLAGAGALWLAVLVAAAPRLSRASTTAESA